MPDRARERPTRLRPASTLQRARPPTARAVSAQYAAPHVGKPSRLGKPLPPRSSSSSSRPTQTDASNRNVARCSEMTVQQSASASPASLSTGPAWRCPDTPSTNACGQRVVKNGKRESQGRSRASCCSRQSLVVRSGGRAGARARLGLGLRRLRDSGVLPRHGPRTSYIADQGPAPPPAARAACGGRKSSFARLGIQPR